MNRSTLAWLLLAAACDRGSVAVHVSVPDLDSVETSAPEIVLTFLPYDRDSVVKSLEAKAGPRPHTRELDSLFRAFREPFVNYLRLKAASDRLTAEKSSATAPRATVVADSLAALAPMVERARTALDRARTALWPAMDSLRRDVKQWENTTYRGYEEIVQTIRNNAMANAVRDTTDKTGWASIELPEGAWWVTGRAIDPRDPNGEWYWNVRITGDTVRLDSRSGRNRARY